ncbi:hypothetical protein [Nocardioides dongkuii]|uniref:hypothetical protein n=1 Tax=Nocardioides dongkuii TaxID=2760089 RepID=UPI0015F82163|nr:hypothetical protein [Nocardioides dongkuii]
MTDADVSDLLRRQDGVASWRQLRAAGVRRHDLDRMLRRRELRRVHPRVYVDHTGPLSWRQRAWAAVLHAEPAALCLASAEPSPDPAGSIHVAVEAGRRVVAPKGVRVHRMRGLGPRVRWAASPPRLLVEENVLEGIDRARAESDVVRLVTDAVGSRRTTVPRLRAAAAARPRLRRRRWVERLLDDVESCACSVLEQGYVARVERPHGLPRPRRQAPRRTAEGVEYRDAEYERLGLVVELEGRLGHEGWTAAGRDADRDLDDRVAGRETVRLRWAQVFDRPCRTADRLARILQRLGWAGSPTRCGPGCQVGAR